MSWQMFAVLYTFGVTGYAIGAKNSGGRISPLLGALIMTACSLTIIIGFFCISIFFMYARGAQLSIAGALTEVISITAVTLVGVLILKEPITFVKLLGLIFSVIGIIFLFEG
jgi:multidrug transporter EmrE-like cation transporter